MGRSCLFSGLEPSGYKPASDSEYEETEVVSGRWPAEVQRQEKEKSFPVTMSIPLI